MTDNRMRDEWRFQRTCGQLAAASDAQATYHRERELIWEAARMTHIDAVPDGLVVEEVAVTGGNMAQVRIDPQVQQRITEAQNRRDNHRRLAEEYEQWADVFRAEPGGRSLDLGFADVAFFWPCGKVGADG